MNTEKLIEFVIACENNDFSKVIRNISSGFKNCGFFSKPDWKEVLITNFGDQMVVEMNNNSENDVGQPTIIQDNMEIVSQKMLTNTSRLSEKNEIADLSLMLCSVKIAKLKLSNYNSQIDGWNNSKTTVTKVQTKSATQNSSGKTIGTKKLKRRLKFDEKRCCCDICGKKLNDKSGIKQHMIIHSGKRPLSCGVCKSTFRQSSHILQHQRIHTGEKPYDCKICERKFRQLSQLQSHLRLHTGEKPYDCEICKRKFRQLSAVQAHLRIHTDEKPYACEVCDKAFRQRATLARHNQTHTGVKRFFCAHCEMSFFQKKVLKGHLKQCFKDHNFQGRLEEHSN